MFSKIFFPKCIKHSALCGEELNGKINENLNPIALSQRKHHIEQCRSWKQLCPNAHFVQFDLILDHPQKLYILDGDFTLR